MHFLRILLLAPVVAMARPWPQSHLMRPRMPLPQDEGAAPPAEGGETPPAEGDGAATGRVIPVVVGGEQDVFVPNVVRAAVGDTIQFQFSAGNHTATQSTADTACVPLEGGVHSGHVPFEDGQTTVGVFEMPVTSEDTMFMYCATGPHCQLGQVLVINPTDDAQVIDYANNALQAPENIDAGDVIGGTVRDIPLEEAAFVPPPPAEEEAGGEGGGEAAAPPPAEGAAPAETAAPAVGSGGFLVIPLPAGGAAGAAPAGSAGEAAAGTSTLTVTVPATAATAVTAA